MYNMEIYSTRLYCIENPYWTRRQRHLVQCGFSIQYRLVQYLSIVYITLYNNLLLLQYTAVRLDLAEKKEHVSVGTFLFSEL
jgi:hypothetical protein